MKAAVRSAYDAALAQAASARSRGDLEAALASLERAHVLGQRYFIPHVVTHVLMMRIGIAKSDRREVLGQVVRLVATVPGYLLGWIPKGNPGTVRVSAMVPMPLTGDLAELLRDYSVWRDVAWRGVVFAATVAIFFAARAYWS